MLNYFDKEPSGVYEDMKVEIKEHSGFDNIKLTKTPYRHSKKCSKHSFHRTKDNRLEVIIPAGVISNREEVREFNSIKDAKSFIRKNIKFLKASALTNISSAVNGTGRFVNKRGQAYGLMFRNI